MVAPRKAYIGCFGSGFGHAVRMLPVAKELRSRGVRVRFSSSGEVAAFIEAEGFECNRLPLADVKYTPEGGVSMKQTVLTSSVILWRTWKQLGLELSNVMRFDPDVVLSDSLLPTVIAGRMLRKRTVTVLNQLRVEAAASSAGVPTRLLTEGTTASLRKLWGLSDSVLLPDLPPPYTISERNLWGGRVAKARYVGFITANEREGSDSTYEGFASDSRVKVFWQVSGPAMTRAPFIKAAVEVAAALADRYVFVISSGDPARSRDARPVNGGWLYGWCAIAQSYISKADVVVSRAGHGTIAQLITRAKPALLVPIPKQAEQEGNAAKAAKLGVAISMRQSEVAPKSVGEALGLLKRGSYSRQVTELSGIARSHDGCREIVRVVTDANYLSP